MNSVPGLPEMVEVRSLNFVVAMCFLTLGLTGRNLSINVLT